MSSDSSVTVSTGSRVGQFGLYRTIDARTEEFLKLSRKRQIRQGCACAAVSTAITVTIVVSVLLVYEYSFNSDFHLNKNYVTRPNWLGWINDSADVTPFEQKYSKMNFNFDKTTLKLLPVLLNALNRNIYLDKIIDDYSSSSPKYIGKDTTEYTYKKNIFNDLRNWYKMPTSKLYSIEYRTSPVVYYRSPAQSIEYFTKIRKTRDYQRILNYFDKMIGDKAGYSSAISTNRHEIYKSNKPQRKSSTIPMRNHNTANSKQRTVILSKSIKDIDNQENGCRCPKKLGELLTKLISSISQLIPYSKLRITLCKDQTFENKSKPLSKSNVIKNITTKTPSSISSTKPVTSSTTARSIKVSFGINEQNRISGKKDFQFPLVKNILKPINDQIQLVSKTRMFYDKPTAVKNYIGITETRKNVPTTTIKPLNMIWKSEDNNSLYQALASKDYSADKSTITPNNKFPSKVSVFDEDEYEDYFATTPNGINNFDTFNVHSLGLVKTKINSPINKVEEVNMKLTEIPKNNNENIKYQTKDSKLNVLKSFKNGNDSNDKMLTKTDPSQNNTFNHITSVPTNISNEIYMLDQLLNNENIILEDEKVLQEEELQEIDYTNKTINTIDTRNKTETELVKIPTNYNNTADDMLEVAKFEENVTPRNYNTMIPEDRPVYLEIQRNDWRQDEHQDFDMNFNNNFFDLTNS